MSGLNFLHTTCICCILLHNFIVHVVCTTRGTILLIHSVDRAVPFRLATAPRHSMPFLQTTDLPPLYRSPKTFVVVAMPPAILFVNSSFCHSLVHPAPRHAITTAFRPRFYTSVSKRHCLIDSARTCTMTSSRPEYDKDNGNVDPSPEDEMLQSELRAKVDELFGSRQNVEIDVSTDVSQAQFTLRDPALSRSASSSMADRFRSPKYILTFIAVVSLVTGTFFTALYFTGAVHGLDPSRDNHYEMPTYGKDSYIDPYQLLEQESQNQTPLGNPKTDSSVQ